MGEGHAGFSHAIKPLAHLPSRNSHALCFVIRTWSSCALCILEKFTEHSVQSGEHVCELSQQKSSCTPVRGGQRAKAAHQHRAAPGGGGPQTLWLASQPQPETFADRRHPDCHGARSTQNLSSYSCETVYGIRIPGYPRCCSIMLQTGRQQLCTLCVPGAWQAREAPGPDAAIQAMCSRLRNGLQLRASDAL